MDVKHNINKKRFQNLRAMILSVALATAAGIGFAAPQFVAAQDQQGQLASPAELSRTFVGVAKQVKPAVVHIRVVERASRTSMRGSQRMPQIPGFPPFGDGGQRRVEGTGSGVIVSPDGYILTNNHVVGEAAEIKVKLADGREVKARRIGTDPETDLAVIKVEESNLPYAKLGNSDELEQGEWVIALGSPFGLQQTMTAGIVSATGRDLPSTGPFVNYIQTDASINPGNSGGPLVNMKGEVIGINTMIFSRSGGSEGIGFAVPSSISSKVVEHLVKDGRVSRGYLGVMLNDLTPAVAEAVNFQGKEGALVQDIAKEDAPAARAGLRSGDVIVEFDGKPIKSAKELTAVAAGTPVGKTVQVKYVRNGRPETTRLSLAERPRPGEEAPAEMEGPEQNTGRLGISVEDITPEVARELKLKIGTGVLIAAVQPDGPASEAGLQRGDVIHRVGRTPIKNRQDLLTAISSLKGESEIVIQIERGGQFAFITVGME
ncbi:MAG TPA: trypsin-like peptidase domain-containing protein [Blastocatellia bacterium]|nr:trypsin-like peptidase domain-containing protein [Blastocatellia bacterium]